MIMGFIGSRKVAILGALLFAILVTGCYDGGWGGGGPGWWGGGSPAYYGGNTYYSKNVYRGYGGEEPRGLFGGYAPAHEAWDASSRGRTSYGGGSGGHTGSKGAGQSGTEGGGHSGSTGGSGGHGGGSGNGH